MKLVEVSSKDKRLIIMSENDGLLVKCNTFFTQCTQIIFWQSKSVNRHWNCGFSFSKPYSRFITMFILFHKLLQVNTLDLFVFIVKSWLHFELFKNFLDHCLFGKAWLYRSLNPHWACWWATPFCRFPSCDLDAFILLCSLV